MRGFTDTENPVLLHVSPEFATVVGAPGPFEIDGGAAERETDGLLVTVGGNRYFVPAAHVVMVVQAQEAESTPPAPPTQLPPSAPDNFAAAVTRFDQERKAR